MNWLFALKTVCLLPITVKVEDHEEEPQVSTYDIEQDDGTKTRVYASPIDETSSKVDIPIVKETETTSTDSKRSQ